VVFSIAFGGASSPMTNPAASATYALFVHRVGPASAFAPYSGMLVDTVRIIVVAFSLIVLFSMVD